MSGSTLFVECHNVTPPVTFTASLESLPTIESYRWRAIQGRIVTTTWRLLYEVKADAVHLLTDKHHETRIYFKNRNPYDLRLCNLTSANNKPLNRHRIENGVGILTLKEGTEVLIDVEDLPFVTQFNWNVGYGNETPYIYAYKPAEPRKSNVKLLLPRYVCSVDNPVHTIAYRDGDWTNCQKQNLVVVNKRDIKLSQHSLTNPTEN